MAGVIPDTALLLTRYDIVLGSFSNYREVAYSIDLSIDGEGVVHLNGTEQNPSYCIDPNSATILGNHWEPDNALADWVKCYLNSQSGYKIYRYLLR